MKPRIDFSILQSDDPKYLSILDLSEYYQLESRPVVISITLPGSEDPVKAYLGKNRVNVFNSINLGLSCFTDCEQEYLDLPDGLYCIKTEISDELYKERYYLRTALLQLDLDKIMVRVGLEYDPSNRAFREWYLNVNIALDAAHAHARTGNIPDCKRMYDEVVLMIDKYKECKNCY